MDKLLPDLSDDQILVKVAQRAACLHRAAKVEVADVNQQFGRFVATYLERPQVVILLADVALVGLDAEVRERIAKMIQGQFIYTPTPEATMAIKELRDVGYGILPVNIASQKVSPDTCDCKLDVIMDNAVPDALQTFLAASCIHHASLPISELHDAVFSENRRKNNFQGVIVRDVPSAAAANYEYKWSFDVNRNLVVDATGLPPQTVSAIRGLVNRPEFKGKVIVNG